jgi:hypothetical protein
MGRPPLRPRYFLGRTYLSTVSRFRLHDGLRRNLDCLTRRRVAAHPRLALRTTSLTMPGSTNSPERFSSFPRAPSARRKTASLRPLHFETLGEVRKQF